LLPRPLQTRAAWKWLTSVAADFALVALNWLLVGAVLVPMRMLFPHVRTFGYAAGAPISLLGLAFLHAALITLVGHTEEPNPAESGLPAQTRVLAKSVMWATAVLCFAFSLQGAPWTMCGLFCIAGGLHFGTLWIWRWRTQQPDRPVQRCFDSVRNVLIVGAGGVGQRVAAYVAQHPAAGRKICGFLDDHVPLGNGVIGRVADLGRMARQEFVDEVILAGPKERGLTQQLLREARRLRLDLEIVPELFGCEPQGPVERVGDLPVICLHSERLPAAGLLLKRLLDALGAGFLLTALFPVLAAIAVLIKIDSRGPVFYSAQRAGRKGWLFRCHKFRTMAANADELKKSLRTSNERSGPIFKITSDPRITGLGRYLRRYSLDELPQLWNVLKGEMSLVGPRPHPLDDVAEYELGHLARLDVTPGITGLWQVTARRDPSFQRGMELDREYIRTWSLGLDLRILFRTCLAVVRGSGD
jgi:exopolysaccharide biosynthesis polyprenyl glycosylphosphotransferase